MLPIPRDPAAWRSEVLAAMAAAADELAVAGSDPDSEEFWHLMEDQAVARARAARGLAALEPQGSDLDRTVDVITDITEALRRHGGGNPNDHHINESQFFLLYYLAAQVHGRVITEPTAGEVVRACWDLDPEPPEADDADDDDDDPPWEIRNPPPTTTDAWIDEILAAWHEIAQPPRLCTSDGRPVEAAGDNLRETAVIFALDRRGVVPPAEAVFALIGVINGMEEDIASLGPELAALKETPPLAFVLYYIWAHILIGHADEEHAMPVVAAAGERLGEFSPGGPKPRKGSSRFRRHN